MHAGIDAHSFAGQTPAGGPEAVIAEYERTGFGYRDYQGGRTCTTCR